MDNNVCPLEKVNGKGSLPIMGRGNSIDIILKPLSLMMAKKSFG